MQYVSSLLSGDSGTLTGLRAAMEATQAVRVAAVREMLGGHIPDPAHAAVLEDTLAALTPPPGQTVTTLALPDGRPLAVDLAREREELRKDLIYLRHGREALFEHLAGRIGGFHEHVESGMRFLGERRFNCFFTDRDGTVQAYHGRYATSVQSAFSAFFLCRFARARTRRPVMLTSAPLRGPGILDVTAIPSGVFAYGASKGREYLDPAGNRGTLPLAPDEKARLAELERRLRRLVHDPRYEIFTLIGSGLQCKYGQITVARQDMDGSVAESLSMEFSRAVRGLVEELDPHGRHWRIEDTGLDLEIILTILDGEGGVKDFDKGDAVAYLDRAMGLAVDHGPHLVCGDTAADIPMVLAAAAHGAETLAVFVGCGEDGPGSVREALPQALFLPHPDVLAALLGLAADQGHASC